MVKNEIILSKNFTLIYVILLWQFVLGRTLIPRKCYESHQFARALPEATIEVMAVWLCTAIFPLLGNKTNGLLTTQGGNRRVNRIPQDKLNASLSIFDCFNRCLIIRLIRNFLANLFINHFSTLINHKNRTS